MLLGGLCLLLGGFATVGMPMGTTVGKGCYWAGDKWLRGSTVYFLHYSLEMNVYGAALFSIDPFFHGTSWATKIPRQRPRWLAFV